MSYSERATKAIKYALNVAKALDEIAYAQADYEYDKEKMSEIQRRMNDIDVAIDETQYD